MDIVYVYSKQRRHFGRQAVLGERPAELTATIPTDEALHSNFMVQNPSHMSVQCSPEMSEHEVNTERFVTKSQGVLHTEGGWPKDVDCTEVEHTIRYRKKVEKDDDYVSAVKTMGKTMLDTIRENTAVDIYEHYFDGDTHRHNNEAPSAKTLTVFRDPSQDKRSVTCVSWLPESSSRVAVAYSFVDFQQASESASVSSYIWDTHNPNFPLLELQPPSPLVSLEYNPKDPHTIVGGCYNGLVCAWDTRKGSVPVETSVIERSHRDPVCSVKWVQSKTATEFLSVSTDGYVYWWDVRKLGEPTDSLALTAKGSDAILGGCSLDYEVSMPTKFTVGTEQGVILACNRKAKSKGDRIVHSYDGHHGPVYALCRNPFLPKYFLSVGDWTAKVWNEDLRSATITTTYHSAYLTAAQWSPTRPGVFVSARRDGVLDVWDYLYNQSRAALSVKVSDAAISALSVHSRGSLVAAGARDGTLTLLRLGEGLAVAQDNEKQAVVQMLERESKREKMLETRAREQRAAANSRAHHNSSMSHPTESSPEEAIAAAEAEFFAAIGASSPAATSPVAPVGKSFMDKVVDTVTDVVDGDDSGHESL